MKVAFIGNCQGEQLAEVFQLMYPGCAIANIPSVHLMDASHESTTIAEVKSCDVIFSHHISSAFPIEFVCTSFLKEVVSSKLLLITNIYSSHYNTQACYIQLPSGERERLQGPLDGIHLRSIIKTYLSGGSISDAMQAYLAYSEFNDSDIQRPLSELARRDTEFLIDIPFAQVFASLSASFETLHTFHHPTLPTIVEYARLIGAKVSLGRPERFNDLALASPKATNSQIHICPHPRCIEFTGCSFTPSTLFRGFPVRVSSSSTTYNIMTQLGRLMTLADVCINFFKLYDSISLAAIEDLSIGSY